MIVIPMAGLSSRFFKAGYTKPKYMLEAHGMTLFDHAVMSFEKYFISEKFIFIVRDVYNTADFVKKSLEKLGIKNFKVVILDKETRGQAETVYLGLKDIEVNDNSSITIFNIDTFRPGFIYPELKNMGDGYLEVFKGSGDNWSFVKSENKDSNKVIETTEKKPISDLCCSGLYYFSTRGIFELAYQDYIRKSEKDWDSGELYIAPIYNYLINNGYQITYNLINRNEVIFCGVPHEYNEFMAL
ncbi:glycosyltransferase family 2 protein [Photobacterium sp. Alg240-V54]|uniref:glycosyltransferase family 2 protein n=1 Tax=Photobacterium sp. Alg240-V54 TaxID=2305995 RepID=UPI0013D7E067|nr:glycosyltransferase family 2 protein [Photobacterium sp. Alg240-V54]